MAEAVWICNRCSDGKVYTSIGADKHKLETKRKGLEHNSFRMIRKPSGIQDTKEQ